MDEYDCVRAFSLSSNKKRKKSKNKVKSNKSDQQDEGTEDAVAHGGWWKIDKYEELKDHIAVEFKPNCYAKATDNGKILLGEKHPPGEGPDEEEIFSVISLGVGKIAIKSGYARYLDVDKTNHLVGLSEVDNGAIIASGEKANVAIRKYRDSKNKDKN